MCCFPPPLSSRLSDLYPAADDPFFTQPEKQKQATTAGQSKEEHKSPEPSQQQKPASSSSATVAHPAHVADPFDMFGEMDRSFDAQMQRMGRIMEHATPAAGAHKDGSSSYSYHSSSSSYSAGPDGSSKPFYRHVSHSTSCVDGVSASRARYEDSLGNRREQQGWGLGQQHRELLLDRNARGEERTHENLKELKPEAVAEFTKQWEQRRAQVDPKNKLIGTGKGSNQPALKNEPAPAIKPAAADKATPAGGSQATHA